MIVTMEYCRIFILVLYSSLDEVRILGLGLLARLLPLALLLISIVQMPRHKNILCRKLAMLLLIRPDIYQHVPAYLEYPMHLR